MRNIILCAFVLVAIVLACPAVADVPAGKTILINHHTSTLKMIDPALCGRAGCDFRYHLAQHLIPVCGDPGPFCDCFAQDWYDVSSANNPNGEEWSEGGTPFLDLLGQGICGLYDGDGFTLWPLSGDVLVRAEFELCEGVTGMEIHIALDNSVAVWLNGTRLSDPPNCTVPSQSPEGFCNSEGCARYDQLKFFVDDSLLRFGSEKNVLAFQVCDHGVGAFFDFDVVADVSGEVSCGACDFVTVSPTELWPPNHKFQEVAVMVGEGATAVPAVITSVRQDEPVRVNKGDKCPDAVIADDGLSVDLRSERLGPPYSPGRIYHLDYEAEMINGQTCAGTATVCVPHDQGAPDNCVDSGAAFDSTVCP